MPSNARRLYQLLGPGILFAAAAIGVSHLVQSTKAGAIYGLAMIPILLLACAAKYPSLLIGLLYPARTGKTLLQSYHEQGWWALGAFLVIAVYSMWFILAAVATTTAGLVLAITGWDAGIEVATAAVMAGGIAILLSGQYQGLEHVSKVLLGILALLLPLATILVLPQLDISAPAWSIESWDVATIAFVIALTGWMPIPVDAAVVSSTWAASRNEQRDQPTTASDARLDFNFGYVLSVVFALCFVVLGAGVMYGSGEAPPQAAGAFATMVIRLFTSQLGDWSFYLIGIVAFVTMFTTLLTVLDGQIRVIFFALKAVRPSIELSTPVYSASMVAFSLGGLSIVTFFMQEFGTFINFVTSLGFLIAPVVVVLNHRAMFQGGVDPDLRTLHRWSWAGGALLCATSCVYFYLALI